MSHPGPLLARGTTADVFAWGEGCILKLYHEPSDTAAREAAQSRAVCAAGAAAPRVVDLVTVDDRPGIVFEQVHGPTMLAAMLKSPGATLARTFARLHADVHARTITGLPTQHARLDSKIRRAVGLGADAKAAALAALATLPEGDGLCHGDFHPNNVLMTDPAPVVIDWVNAMRGDAHGDVARTLVILEHAGAAAAAELPPEARRSFAFEYLKSYGALRPLDPGRLHTWRAVAAAGRLSEAIDGAERAALVTLVDTWRAGTSK